MNHFELPVSLRVRAPLKRVFAAWLNEADARWLCDRQEGRWAAGEKVFWNFGGERQEIRVVAVEAERVVRFRWNAYGTQSETEVVIEFRDHGSETGLVLREVGWELALENVKVALDHACGWENLFCRLKAWVEAGVELR